jgi:hypothetical protein
MEPVKQAQAPVIPVETEEKKNCAVEVGGKDCAIESNDAATDAEVCIDKKDEKKEECCEEKKGESCSDS